MTQINQNSSISYNIETNSNTENHNTPLEIIEASYGLMGGIDLDSCSNDKAIKYQGKYAPKTYFTKQENGLYFIDANDTIIDRSWQVPSYQLSNADPPVKSSRVFLNPPGRGKLIKSDPEYIWKSNFGSDSAKKCRSVAGVWGFKLLQEYQKGNVKEAVFLIFNSKLIGSIPWIFNYPVCMLSADSTANCVTGSGRIKFLNEDMEEGSQPQNSSAIVYLPPLYMKNMDFHVDRFKEYFNKFGTIVMGQ